jgi:hypothetical protein
MEQLVEVLVWFAISYAIAKVAIRWVVDRVTQQLRADIEEFADRLATGKLIPVTVEVDQDQYFCYNALTKDFVCQGFTLAEVAERFLARFPESKLAIYNGDETAVQVLKEQLEKYYEDRNSK